MELAISPTRRLSNSCHAFAISFVEDWLERQLPRALKPMRQWSQKIGRFCSLHKDRAFPNPTWVMEEWQQNSEWIIVAWELLTHTLKFRLVTAILCTQATRTFPSSDFRVCPDSGYSKVGVTGWKNYWQNGCGPLGVDWRSLERGRWTLERVNLTLMCCALPSLLSYRIVDIVFQEKDLETGSTVASEFLPKI